MLSSDLHASLYSVARLMPLGDDFGQAHLQADQAEELFATYLVAAGHIPAGQPVSHAVRGWTASTPVGVVARELRTAAQFLSTARPASHRCAYGRDGAGRTSPRA